MSYPPAPDNHPDDLSPDDLRAYQAGQLTGAAHHRVERLLLENPLYADALEGLDALRAAGGNLTHQTQALHRALQVRIRETANPRRLMPLWVATLLASVLLVICVAIFLIFRPKTPAPTPAFAPGTILLDPAALGPARPAPAARATPIRPDTLAGRPRHQ